ncbi:hypothetical protein FAGKG844_60114 [Frankia sp. AgKG'84/4]
MWIFGWGGPAPWFAHRGAVLSIPGLESYLRHTHPEHDEV